MTNASTPDAAESARSAGPPERRRQFQPRAIVAIAVVWMLLWDQLSWGNLVNGLLVGLFVTLAFPLPSIQYAGSFRPLRYAMLIGRFLLDLVASSWQVTRLALGPRTPRNAVIEVALRSRSDFYLTITAELVTLVPGSVVIEARRSTSTLYLHLIDVGRPGAIESQRRDVLAVEERVVRALGSRAEIAALEQAKRSDRRAGPAGEGS
ncbi:MAG: Na+/H+ antiporter subunit E [Humibacillus sp.]|nr:Na+/H+ antiporter subunit E [Humibacillus sp.]MDN5778097.1 Na+/H+ antiporter subunit E [Humibacillus sp.]